MGRFTPGLEGWSVARPDRSVPPTRFRVRTWDGVVGVEAIANRSMAMLTRALAPDFDLGATPVLCWRWRIDAPVRSANWSEKRGDDYAARVYVGVRETRDSRSLLERAQMRVARAIWGEDLPAAALNYVWDNRHPVGARRANAFTARAQMIVAETGEERAGRWVEERQDVERDLITVFGADALVSSVAVASDTDNTGESVRAGFADLHFVARDERCAFSALPEPGGYGWLGAAERVRGRAR